MRFEPGLHAELFVPSIGPPTEVTYVWEEQYFFGKRLHLQ